MLPKEKAAKERRNDHRSLLDHLLEHAEEVAAQDLGDVLVAVTPVDQHAGDEGQPGAIGQLRGAEAEAVEVGSQPDVIHPRHLGDVVNMIHHPLEVDRRKLPSRLLVANG